MEGKTEEEVERYAEVFKRRYKELNGKRINFYDDCASFSVILVHTDEVNQFRIKSRKKRKEKQLLMLNLLHLLKTDILLIV